MKEGRAGTADDDSYAEVPHPPGVRDLKRDRLAMVTRLEAQNVPSAERRRLTSRLVLDRLAEHWQLADGPDDGIALGAVGSAGRLDMGPCSDLDLVLIHDGRTHSAAAVAALAQRLWYPIWDAGLDLDYSMRSITECRQVASKDLAAGAGLLDLAPVAGDAALVQQARAAIYQDWRSAARKRLPELLAASRARADRHGELAYLIEPNLKESRGGLRDLTSLSALSATWLTDRPHGAVDDAGEHLKDVRDAIQVIAGRDVLVLGRHLADDVAAHLSYANADDLLASLAQAGRVIAYALDTTERGARRSLERSGIGSRAWRARRHRTAPRHVDVATGLIDVDGELALAPSYDETTDALLPLRAAATAATTGLSFTPDLLAALTRCPDLPTPWPDEARGHLRDLLRSTQHLVSVWEAVDLHGLVVRWMPHWSGVRNRPQRSPVHRFTVDRHMLETVVLAAKYRRQVPDPDLLLLSALLHDIGKRAGAVDHSIDGAALIPDLLGAMGFSEEIIGDVALLVRHHLLLAESATNRDPEDPVTVAAIVEALDGRSDLFETLRALTEADARAAGPKAWTSWRASLIDTLTARVRDALALRAR